MQLFGDEWRHLQASKRPRRLWPPAAVRAWVDGYHELGTIERIVPLAYAVIYVIELVRQVAA